MAIVISDKRQLDNLEQVLLKLENRTGKRTRKWGWLNLKEKTRYLQSVLGVGALRQSIFYSIHESSKEYTRLTALSIAGAVLAKVDNGSDYKANIFIDGLKGKEEETVRREVKKLKVRYGRIRGLAHKKSALIRLADAMAGFLRDYQEGEDYASRFFDRFKKLGITEQV